MGEELCSGGGDAQRSLKCSKARKDAWEEDTQKYCKMNMFISGLGVNTI